MVQGESIGITSKTVDGLIADLKNGLPVHSLSLLSTNLGVPEKRIALTVSIPQRTLTQRKKEGRFKPDESERVFRLARLYERALGVLGDASAARKWFNSCVKGIGNKTPLDYADTEIGAREVEDMLGRIEDGVFY
jgi:putative toxin-antitoxin system antitoxin component (TIGR02293 family)